MGDYLVFQQATQANSAWPSLWVGMMSTADGHSPTAGEEMASSV